MSRPDPRSHVHVDVTTTSGHTLLVMDGVLDGITYLTVRDAVVKAALEMPPLVVVDVSRLRAPTPSAWSVFTSARWLVVDWPDVPIVLTCAHQEGRRTLARNGIARYIPVYGSVGSALGATSKDIRPVRRRVRQTWPASPAAVVSTRGFVSHWLLAWSLPELTSTAGVVASVLVDNVLRHTASDPDVRLETDGTRVTVAVADGDPAPACVREDDALAGALSELQIVKALSRVWGNTPTRDGKVVWAVIGPENGL